MARRLTAAELVQLAFSAGWSAKDAPTAAAIALAESGGNPAARGGPNPNGSYDHGLWQINSVHGAAGKDWSNPSTNASMAYAVFKSQGWRAWTVYRTGAYLAFLPATRAAAPRGGYVPAGGAAPAAKKKCPAEWTKTKTKPKSTDKKVDKPEPSIDGPGMIQFPQYDQFYQTKEGCYYAWQEDEQQRVYWGNEDINVVDTPGEVDLGAAGDVLGAVGDLLSFLANPDNWLRIVWVVGGSALVIGALMVAMKGQQR